MLIDYYVYQNIYLKYKLKNRLEQRGLLKRFTSDCIKPSLEDIKSKKSKILELVKQKKLSKKSQEIDIIFLDIHLVKEGKPKKKNKN